MNKVNSNISDKTISKLFKNPIWLLKEGSKHGIKSIKKLFLIAFLFGAVNTILFIFSIYRTLITSFTYEKSLVLLFILCASIGITFYAIFKAYWYVVFDILKIFYNQTKPLLKKASIVLIDKSEHLLNNSANKKELSKSIHIKKNLKNTFQKIPKLLSHSIIYLLLQVPIIEMLLDVRELLTDHNKTKASNELFNKIDQFIIESIFEGNNTLWVWWILPLNIIGIVIIIFSKIG